MNDSIHIRPATVADIPALEDLVVASMRGLNTQDYSLEQVESALKYIAGVDEQLITDSTYYVAECDGRVVGGGGWSRRRTLYGRGDAQDADTMLNPHCEPAKIRAVFVHPDYARRGIGQRLMSMSEQSARCGGFTRLELLATLTGQPLYLKCGFRTTDIADLEMPDGVRFPVIHMEKHIFAW